jgi:hypothetical protein
MHKAKPEKIQKYKRAYNNNPFFKVTITFHYCRKIKTGIVKCLNLETNAIQITI